MNPQRMILAASVSIVMIAALGQTCEPKSMVPQAADQRIDSIHKGFQHALEDLSMTKARTIKVTDADGKTRTVNAPPSFGFDRETPIAILHDKVLRDTHVGRIDTSTTSKINAYGASCSGKPLQPGKLRVKNMFWVEGGTMYQAQQKWATAIANKTVAELRDKDVVCGISAGRLYEARPLRISGKECLSCHSGSKIGDPLAIMVYEVRNSNSLRAR